MLTEEKNATKIAELFQTEFERLLESINSSLDSVTELRNTNDSLLSTKQNEIMKTLTVVAFITLPLSVIANIFNMTTVYTPIVGMPNDFWIITGIMLVTTILLFAYVKYKRWL